MASLIVTGPLDCKRFSRFVEDVIYVSLVIPGSLACVWGDIVLHPLQECKECNSFASRLNSSRNPLSGVSCTPLEKVGDFIYVEILVAKFVIS